MIEQIKNIINELQANHQHLVLFCSITGAKDTHSVHILAMTDSDNPEEPTILKNEDLNATIEDFQHVINTIDEKTFGGQIDAYIPELWAMFYGLYGNEMSGLKRIINDAITDNDWSVNDELGIGFRIEIT